MPWFYILASMTEHTVFVSSKKREITLVLRFVQSCNSDTIVGRSNMCIFFFFWGVEVYIYIISITLSKICFYMGDPHLNNRTNQICILTLQQGLTRRRLARFLISNGSDWSLKVRLFQIMIIISFYHLQFSFLALQNRRTGINCMNQSLITSSCK